MKIKALFSMLLLVSLILVVVVGSNYKKDGANLEYVPAFSADNTSVSINIAGLDVVLSDPEKSAFVSSLVYDYITKFESSPDNTFVVTNIERKLLNTDENNITTNVFYIENSNTNLQIKLRYENNFWVSGVITNQKTGNTYSSYKNLTPSPSFEGN